jgi:Phage tail tube protein
MSAKIIGRQFQFGFAKETSRGTVAAPTYWVPFNDLTIDEKQEKVFDAQSYGIIEDSVAALTTKKWAEGSLAGNVYDTTFGLILYSLLGTLTSHSAHSGETTVYDNIFNVQEGAQHKSLTFAVHDPAAGQDYAYANGVISKLEIKYALKQFVQYTASLMAQAGTTESAYTPSTTTENRFVPQYLTLTVGGTTIKVKSASISIDQNVEAQDVLGSLSPADFLNKEFKVDGQIEAIWQNESDFKTAFLANTAQDFKFDLKNTDVTIGSAANPELILEMPQCYITDLGRPIKVKDLIYQTIKFRATYSLSSSYMLKATLTNIVNGY